MDNNYMKFTEEARRVMVIAQEEARRLNHNYIGTEHLLLGLSRAGEESISAVVLTSFGITAQRIRQAVEFIIGRGNRVVVGEIGLTPRAKDVIKFALAEARRLQHNYIGAEHLLLGIVLEGEGIAAGVLASLGLTDLVKLRAEILNVLVTRAEMARNEQLLKEPPSNE